MPVAEWGRSHLVGVDFGPPFICKGPGLTVPAEGRRFRQAQLLAPIYGSQESQQRTHLQLLYTPQNTELIPSTNVNCQYVCYSPTKGKTSMVQPTGNKLIESPSGVFAGTSGRL